jgi:asparaginyl-tRNA synthetase
MERRLGSSVSIIGSAGARQCHSLISGLIFWERRFILASMCTLIFFSSSLIGGVSGYQRIFPARRLARPPFTLSRFLHERYLSIPPNKRSQFLPRACRDNDRCNLFRFSSTLLGSAKVDAVTSEEKAISAFGGTSLTTALRRVKTVAVKATDSNINTGELIMIKGWVRTLRKQKTVAFIEVNDGSNLSGLQCVLSLVNPDGADNNSNAVVMDEESRHQLDLVTTGCSVELIGSLVSSQGGSGKKQSVELSATNLRVIGICPADSYPLAKKRHSLEYLRSIAHLRSRTNTIAAVARVRSKLAGAIHDFFQNVVQFTYVQTPLITTADCEGAGELFRVTTLNLDNVPSIARRKVVEAKGASTDQKPAESAAADYTQDFFGKPAYLTVSGQLSAETYACALGDVYTFGPTFRAENSQTTRHLAEFHSKCARRLCLLHGLSGSCTEISSQSHLFLPVLEPEMAFADLQSAMNNAEQMLKYVVSQVLQHCREDLEFFNNFYDKQLLTRLQKVVDTPFVRISYREAIQLLQEEIAKDPSKWQFPVVEFGTDLATEHERWLAETKFESAVFVYNYPRSIKAFYMRNNDDDNGETVHAMDLLVPGVGELIGGSQREERLDVLERKIQEMDGLSLDDYWWYLDLRRYGSVPHAGYGLGFERLVTYVCGMENIRDAIAFPRFPGNAEF